MDHLERQHLRLDQRTPWCSTRPTACSTWAFSTTLPPWRAVPQRAPDAAVLGHLPGGHRQAQRAVHENARADHGAGPACRGQDRAALVRGQNSERLHAVSQLLGHFRPDSSIAFCNTKQQCRDLVAVLQAQGSARWRCLASWSSASATRCWCSLPTAAARCWWPPMWPRAAWTLPTWRPSSTSM